MTQPKTEQSIFELEMKDVYEAEVNSGPTNRITKQLPKSDELIITCSCSSLDHSVRFTFWPWDRNDEANGMEAYIDVCLNYERSWWGRIKTAFRYLFQLTCGFGQVAEIIVKDEDLAKVKAWVERAEQE